jgi:hypothetical protein
MRIAGKFSRVSRTTYRDGVVLVGLIGDIYPHDLKSDEIAYIKAFYNMPGSNHEIYTTWPDRVEPAYTAAKTNIKNGYLLLTVVPAT